jgi:hypothetical protein
VLATVLGCVKRWVLAMLTFCKAAKSCAWLRFRREKNAALLTHPARHDHREVSGRRASRKYQPASGGSNKGL